MPLGIPGRCRQQRVISGTSLLVGDCGKYPCSLIEGPVVPRECAQCACRLLGSHDFEKGFRGFKWDNDTPDVIPSI